MLILGFVLAAVLLASVTLNKTYYHLPLRELKRRARSGDELAKQLYKPAAYGMDLRLLLGFLSILSAAGSTFLFSQNLPNFWGFLLSGLVLWVAFMWLPTTKQTGFASSFSKIMAPFVARILHYLHGPLSFISQLVGKYYPFNSHTGLYSKDDLVDLLDWQKHQSDNQVPVAEIDLAKNSLELGRKTIGDILMPAKNVRLVSASEPISPILIDELHKTGHKYFPIYDGKKSNIVGVLELADLVSAARRTSPVSSIMNRNIKYVHEDFTLPQFIQAITKAQQHLFVVINSFEEFVGIVTASDFLNQLLVQPSGEQDSFDDYESSAAVAEVMKRKEAAAARPADIELSEEHFNGEPVAGELATEPVEAAETPEAGLPAETSEPEPEPPEI